MTPSFTPGPWTSDNQWITDKTGLVTIATMATNPDGYGPYNGSLANEANARLIAAAPELYEALTETVRSLEWAALVIKDIPEKSAYMENLVEAKALLAKIEGV